jgi:hypothetical protein
MKNELVIEFLFWQDCPSHQEALKRLRQVMEDMDLDVPVREIEVLNQEEAERLSFPGSPTIRVNGADVDPAGAALMEVALTCRLYRLEDGRPSPLPSKQMIRRALGGE